MKYPRLLQLVALTLIAALPVTGLKAVDLPRIGDRADSVMSPAEERRLGQQVMNAIRAQGLIIDDPEINSYIQEVGQRLVAQTDQPDQAFNFFVIRDPSINAFALPGGFIGINSGLLLATDDESELAGVLAHEITHVTQRHIARRIEATRGVDMAASAAILAAILLGAGDPNIVAGAISGGMAASVQNMINYTHAFEHEADRIGIQLMAGAGFDPEGMARFFAKMDEKSRFREGGISDFIRTHPVTSARITEARDRARQIGEVEPSDSMSYLLVRASLRVSSARRAGDAAAYYREQAGLREGPRRVAALYGLALARHAAGDSGPAEELLAELVRENQQIPALRTALARVQIARNRSEQAHETLAGALEIFPRNPALSIEYAGLLLDQGDAEKAHTLLGRIDTPGQPTLRVRRLQAHAAEATGRNVDAHIYLADYNMMRGNLQEAINQLELGLSREELTEMQRERLQARLRELQRIRDA